MFIVTGLFSFLAYIWLLIILRVVTPDVIDLWEASVTFALFPVLVFFAYGADRGWCGLKAFRSTNKQQLELGPLQKEQSKLNLYDTTIGILINSAEVAIVYNIYICQC